MKHVLGKKLYLAIVNNLFKKKVYKTYVNFSKITKIIVYFHLTQNFPKN
jgi:hypothetical protein